MDRKPKRTLESDLPLLEGADVPVPATLEAAVARQRFRVDLGLILAKVPGVALKA